MPLVSKNHIGCAGLLFLVLILSQARLFDTLFNTALGRVILISIILFLSYLNKILGVIGVLLIIIAFNHSSFRILLEGLETSKANKIEVSTAKKINTEPMKTNDDHASNQDTKEPEKKQSKNTVAAEGFDIIGLENSIKRGKQSNSIPVKERNGTLNDDVFAYETASIFGTFSPW